MSLNPLSGSKRNNIFTLNDLRAREDVDSSNENQNRRIIYPNHITTLSDLPPARDPLKEEIGNLGAAIDELGSAIANSVTLGKDTSAMIEDATNRLQKTTDQLNEFSTQMKISCEEFSNSIRTAGESHKKECEEIKQKMSDMDRAHDGTFFSFLFDCIRAIKDGVCSFCGALFGRIWR